MEASIKFLGHDFIFTVQPHLNGYKNYTCNKCNLWACTYLDGHYKVFKMGTFIFERNVEITCDEQMIKNLLE